MAIKISSIITNANIKVDDNINANICLIYLNQGITKINTECALKLPTILPDNIADNDYMISDEDFVNDIVANILVSFIAYCIYQNDGYSNSENTFFSEYLSALTQFRIKFRHFVYPDFILPDSQNGAIIATGGTSGLFFKKTPMF